MESSRSVDESFVAIDRSFGRGRPPLRGPSLKSKPNGCQESKVTAMATEPSKGGPPELPQEAEAALAAGAEQLVSAVAELEAMPQVRLTPAFLFDRARPPGSRAQLRGAICKVICCNKQIDHKCNDKTDAAACPSHVEAVKILRQKVQQQHGSEACLSKAHEKLAAEGSSTAGSTEPPRDVFAAMLGARLAIQRARSALTQAEQGAEQCRAAALALPARALLVSTGIRCAGGAQD